MIAPRALLALTARRRTPLAVAAVVLIVLTAGCNVHSATAVATATALPSGSPAAGMSWPRGFGQTPTTSPTWHGNAIPNPLGPPCTFGQLRGSYANGVVPRTGENSLFINLVNTSQSPCTVGGYPEVAFFSAGLALVFQVRHTGNYLDGATAEPARQRQVMPGAALHIFIAKYRCDNGAAQVADSVSVQLLGGAALATVPLPVAYDVEYCQPQPGTQPVADPGNVLQISGFLPGQGVGN